MHYLIEIHHGIGDIVQMLGVIETINHGDHAAKIDLILNKCAYGDLFKHDDRINTVYIIDLVTMSKAELIKTALTMRNNKYDYMFLSPISNQKAAQMLAFLINPKKCYGEQLVQLGKWIRKYKTVDKENCHMVYRNQNVFAKSDLNFKMYPPRIKGVEDVLKNLNVKYKFKGNTQNRIALCIGTSLPAKTWAIDKFLELANIYTDRGYQIVFIGGKDEEKKYEELQLCKNDLWENYMGQLTLIESAAVLKSCNVVIGGDTGMMHIAAAVGCSTLTIFSCTNPKLHCPFSEKSFYIETKVPCQYCYYTQDYESCIDYKCLNITVEEMCEAVDNAINNNINCKYYFNMK